MSRKNEYYNAEGKRREKKPDTTKNPNRLNHEEVKRIESKKVPLRISEKVTIMVVPENCNAAYAEEYRIKTRMK